MLTFDAFGRLDIKQPSNSIFSRTTSWNRILMNYIILHKILNLTSPLSSLIIAQNKPLINGISAI